LDSIRSIANLITIHQSGLSALAHSLGIGTTRSHPWFADAVVPLRPSRGRPRTPGLDFITQRVHEFRDVRGIRCGYRHIAESIASPREAPPYEAVYRPLYPLDARPPRLPRVHTHRFVARYVDYLWHMDLHEIQVTDDRATGIYTLYLIAFIDDASRFII
jgi:hypothetical protein